MKKVPKKNYIILGIMFIFVLALTLYLKKWSEVYKENKLSNSPLSGKVEEVKLEELSTVVGEMNEVIVYIGHTNDKKVYNVEKRLLKYLKDKDILDKFIYVDVTNNKDYKEVLKEVFPKIKDEIKTSPMLIYNKNDSITEVINNDNGAIYTYNLEEFYNKYQIEK